MHPLGDGSWWGYKNSSSSSSSDPASKPHEGMSSSTTHSITTCCLTEAQKLRSIWLRKDASKTVSQNTPFFLRWLAQVFCFPNGRLADTPLPVKCDSFWLSPKLLLITRLISRTGVLPSSLPLSLTTYLRFCLKGTLRVINGIRRQARNQLYRQESYYWIFQKTIKNKSSMKMK